MAFTKFTKDPGVISALSNKPNTSDGLTPAALKAKFDELGTAIKAYLNETLLSELEDDGAESIGIQSITGLTAATVQEALAALKEAVDGVSAGSIPNASLTTAKLADLCVTTAKLSELAVTTAKLADAAVTAAKLAADAVETAKIKDGAVTEAKLAAASVTGSKLGAGAVGTENLADGAVTAAKLPNASIPNTKLATDAVRLRFENVSVPTSGWEADQTYADYPLRAEVTLQGVTADMRPEIVLGLADAVSGNIAPVAESYAGGVYLYAKTQPDAAVVLAVADFVR